MRFFAQACCEAGRWRWFLGLGSSSKGEKRQQDRVTANLLCGAWRNSHWMHKLAPEQLKQLASYFVTRERVMPMCAYCCGCSCRVFCSSRRGIVMQRHKGEAEKGLHETLVPLAHVARPKPKLALKVDAEFRDSASLASAQRCLRRGTYRCCPYAGSFASLPCYVGCVQVLVALRLHLRGAVDIDQCEEVSRPAGAGLLQAKAHLDPSTSAESNGERAWPFRVELRPAARGVGVGPCDLGRGLARCPATSGDHSNATHFRHLKHVSFTLKTI